MGGAFYRGFHDGADLDGHVRSTAGRPGRMDLKDFGPFFIYSNWSVSPGLANCTPLSRPPTSYRNSEASLHSSTKAVDARYGQVQYQPDPV